MPRGRFFDLNDAFATFHRFKSKDECARTLAEYPDILEVFLANGVGLPAGLDWRQSHSLGLRLVRMLARQLMGTVEVSTGAGTEFLLTFDPRAPEKPGEADHE
jgi:two-component sensor histidine kinase